MLSLSMFDEYGRKAQLYPALLVVLPPLVTLLVLFPSLMSLKGTIGAVVVGCGTLVLMANLGRDAGRRKQDLLFPDGLPTQRWLRHRDLTLEAPTKDRYKEFLLGKVPGLKFPTADEEQTDPAAADGAYRSAVRWLVDNTRSVKRVQQENIAYGFRRNLYGLKPWGLLAAIAAAVIAGVVLWLRHGMAIETIPAEALVVFAFDAVVLPVMWTIAIRSTWVASAADGYALALFGFCDQAERRPAKEK